MINKSIRLFKELFNQSYRNLLQDNINLNLSLQSENLLKRMSELEFIVKESQEFIHELGLRTPDVIEVDKMVEPILHEIRELVRPQKYRIANLEFFGNEFDGGYFISSKLGKKINLISIGIGDNCTFDLEVAKRGGIVHMYDGTIKKIQNLPENMFFVEKNVGNNDKTNEIELTLVVKRFLESITTLDDVNAIKIDIEGNEWKIFDKFDFNYLKNFNTLIVEFHEINENLKNKDQQKLMIDVLSNIKNYFVPIYFCPNNWSQVIRSGLQLLPNVFEIVYINREQYVDDDILVHESADNYHKPKNNPFRPSLGKFFI